MSDYKEQLNAITDNEIKAILNSEQASDFEIISRGIIPLGSIEVSVEGNTNTDIQRFQLNRYFDGVDLSSKYIRVGFTTVYGIVDYSDATNITIDASGDIFYFDWVVDSRVTAGAGKIKVKIECFEINSQNKTIYSWNTEEIELKILPTISIFRNAVEKDYALEKAFYESNDNNIVYSDIHDTDPPVIIEGRDILLINKKDIIVEHDNRSQIMTFVMSRSKYDFDPANMTIAIGFENAIGQSDWSVCVNRIVTDSSVTFGWLMDSKVSFKAGTVKFRVELMGYNSKNEWMDWKTNFTSFDVPESFPINVDAQLDEPSFTQKWISESEEVLNQCKDYSNSASNSASSALSSKNSANTSAVNASDSANSAAASAQSAAQSATVAQNSETAAGNSASDAQTSAVKAASSEEKADKSAEEATASATNAKNYADQAELYKNDAATSAQNAQTAAEMFEQAILVTDWNDAINPGFYYSANNAANAPTFEGAAGGTGLYGLVFCYGKQVRQVVMPGFGSGCKIRFCGNPQTWYPWMDSLPLASESMKINGLMSCADKAKLDNTYTKEDSRQTFANAFVGEKSGTVVSLSLIHIFLLVFSKNWGARWQNS